MYRLLDVILQIHEEAPLPLEKILDQFMRSPFSYI